MYELCLIFVSLVLLQCSAVPENGAVSSTMPKYHYIEQQCLTLEFFCPITAATIIQIYISTLCYARPHNVLLSFYFF